MTTGYFHYKKPGQVLTVYYEITPSVGLLKYSCSLWRQGYKDEQKTVKEIWIRKDENAHAKTNFSTEFVTHMFTPFEQGDLKLDDIWLKKYIHKHICAHGRKRNEFISNEIQKNGYKTVEDCYKQRGHVLPDFIDPQTGLPKLVEDDDGDDSEEGQEEEKDSGFLEQLVKWLYSSSL
jgi:hypothetical protein